MSTKLINPTDDELNANFAVWVAGWRNDPDEGWRNEHGVPITAVYYRDFTRSMDAVLPWLNAPGWLWHISNDEIHTDKPFTACVHRGLAEASASDTNAPRACVIALLRANGVEVVCP